MAFERETSEGMTCGASRACGKDEGTVPTIAMRHTGVE